MGLERDRERSQAQKEKDQTTGQAVLEAQTNIKTSLISDTQSDIKIFF